MPSEAADIYLLYAEEDAPTAAWLDQRLTAEGYWVIHSNDTDFSAGMWLRAKRAIVLMSQALLGSKEGMEKYYATYAKHHATPRGLIPLSLGDVDANEFPGLGGIRCIDLTRVGNDKVPYILRAISGVRYRPMTAPPWLKREPPA